MQPDCDDLDASGRDPVDDPTPSEADSAHPRELAFSWLIELGIALELGERRAYLSLW